MIELFNLRMYYRDGNQFHLIDETFSRDKEELVNLATERSQLCAQYVPILLVFKPNDVMIV